MLKKILACSVVSLFVLCGAVSFSMADEAGPADIVIKGDQKEKPKKAVFPHKKHQETLKCAECHHAMAEGKQVAFAEGQKIEKCATCHNSSSKELAGKTMGKLKLDTMKGAGHGNCLACHKAEAKKDESKKALKKCATCHPKK